MTLVLGPPGSGKSTFLRALAGKLDSSLKFNGRVMHNGEELSSSTPQNMRAYISQSDLHHAEMTVRETLNFSSHLLGTNNAFEMPRQAIGKNEGPVNELDLELDASVKATTRGEGTNVTTNYIIKMLNLRECADIIVGDELRRGISGGLKKRVTIGEMLVGLARCFFMDDISTGLDSSTTFEIVKFLRQMAHLMDITMAISLLQPLPETFELFDDIILLCEGNIVYQGPRENVTEFFEYTGFKCPERKNIADFLQEVMSKMDQEQYWSSENPLKYQYHSIEKLSESFKSFHTGQLLQNNLQIPNTYENTANSSKISKWKIFKACFSRELLLLKRNSPLHIFKTIQIGFLSFVVTTLFLHTEMKHMSIIDGNNMGSNMTLIDELNTPKPGIGDLHFPSGYWQSFKSQCIACLWKQHYSYWKNPEHNVVRFVNTFGISLLFGAVFWQIGSTITKVQDVYNILGIAYGSALYLGFVNASILQPVVAMERVVFYRERSAGMYSSMPYAIAQMAIEVPYIIIQVLIFSAIIFPMVGFKFTVIKFLWFILFLMLSFTYYTLYGMMTVALTPNIEIAGGLSFLVFILWNIFSGFMIPRNMIPVWWRWSYWADPGAWTLYGLVFSQLGDRSEIIQVPGGLNQTVSEFINDYLGLEDLLHVVVIVLFGFIFGLSIKYLNFQRR
ncbi:hypothetical protein LUZ60_015882 [Juncus effusus]|nr:hypothetical protein LUZ60_015882 [Juncus effusus]